MRCFGCELEVADCLCPAARCESRLSVLVVMHPLERWRKSNTGRLAPLALARAELVEPGAEIGAALTTGLRTALLLPGGPPATPERLASIDRVVALDGTWRQVRRMRRGPALAALPSLTLPARPDQRRLRRPRHPVESSTAEAIAIALELAGDTAASAALRRTYHRLIDVLTRPGLPRGDLVQ